MNTELIIATVIAIVALAIGFLQVVKFRRAFLVPEGYAGLLYYKGKFVEVLPAGQHIRWGRKFTLGVADLRKTSFVVAGQEILTSDNVGLRVSLLVTYQVSDPAKAAHETQNWQGDLYNAAQIAVRKVVSGVAVEALLSQRLDVGAQLVALVHPDIAKIGITIHAVEVKDVMLPADLKRAFGEVLKAKQEGQAALERARGESASLRNLANAARVLDGNPALMNLRVLQSIATAQSKGNTLVLGMPAGFIPLKNGKTASPETSRDDNGAS